MAAKPPVSWCSCGHPGAQHTKWKRDDAGEFRQGCSDADCTCERFLRVPAPKRAARPAARRTDPSTSHEAAASITEDQLTERQRAVYGFLRAGGPMTDEALVERYQRAPYVRVRGLPQQSPSGIRTRRAELTAAGLVKDSGDKAMLASGRRGIVWAAVPPASA